MTPNGKNHCWNLTPDRMVLYKATLPIPAKAQIRPRSWSEADMHSAAILNRNAERSPPDFPVHPVGTWRRMDCPTGRIYVSQLRRVATDKLLRTEHDQNDYLIEKYATWLARSGRYPPIDADLRIDGRHVVTQGHHRLGALRRIGQRITLAWVNPPTIRNGNEYALDWDAAVHEAHLAGHRISDDVWMLWQERERKQ